jgi:hypothetical protein
MIKENHKLGPLQKAQTPGLLRKNVDSIRYGVGIPTFNDGGAANEVISADELLRRRAAALRDRDPGLSQAQALLKASANPDFIRTHQAEMQRRMIQVTRQYG